MNSRLDSLLNRWMDGELTPPEAEAVQLMLAEDPEARRMCYDLLIVDRLLDERAGSKEENIPMMDTLASDLAHGRGRSRFGMRHLAIAALVALLLVVTSLMWWPSPSAAHQAGPVVTGSADSRITIAQRQGSSQWNVGELLRLERGSVEIKLNGTVSATVDGPAALELIGANGSVRLLEGTASFITGGRRDGFEVQVPGGVLHEAGGRFTVDIHSDGVARVWVETGFLEIRRHAGLEPVYMKTGEAVSLEPDGKAHPIHLTDPYFRNGRPAQVALFRDDFDIKKAMLLSGHVPEIGQTWKILSELNPTLVRQRRLDTSSGARMLVANLANHETGGPRAVYVFSFDLIPPERIQDKVTRQGGLEYISLVDGLGNRIVSISARAANGHRWQLVDDRKQITTDYTQVCSLWTHSLTLCYGLDGLVTLHDGPTAQAPIIAGLHVTTPPPVAGILLGNSDGGDLAFSKIEAALLPSAR